MEEYLTSFGGTRVLIRVPHSMQSHILGSGKRAVAVFEELVHRREGVIEQSSISTTWMYLVWLRNFGVDG